jgi:hypothetical protein
VKPKDLRLRELLSEARYLGYLKSANGDHARAARLFEWNTSLSAAYWPAIAVVEVAIRNAINAHLCSQLGVSTSEGWHVHAFGEKRRIHLLERDLARLKSSIDAFRRRRRPNGQHAHPTGDDVVGGTSLGLWVALCGEGRPRHPTLDYHRQIWRGRRLWQAFPHYRSWLVEGCVQ